ncbi:uncharacterized protein LOC117105694 isoform X2 [Anneissia japonica]|uniref:uncharacterized protein LOC117105694 isoform X2 n=1 Tax=Anneissia japonica TaxID=1529436 RepID=UPI001425AE1C|nr:uncharacterized protein LOC117105694 isoform X2 [Anneissia japonica]
MEGDTSKGISDDDFREILISMSGWYDRHGYINMLKVLYRDLVTKPDKLYAATKVIELFELLHTSGLLSPADLTVLYDTINVTKPFGLEPEIGMLSMTTLFDIRAVIVSKFAPNRQSLIKFVESLTDNDVKKISKLYCCEQNIDKWGLIVDLEHRGKICEENMDDFLKKLTTYLIIDSNNDPLGLRTGKSNKDSIQETTSGISTDIEGEVMLTGYTVTGGTLTCDTEAGPSTSTGTAIGTQFVNCNITDSVINIVNNTIQLPATQDNATRPSEDDVIKNYLLSTQLQLCRNATRFTPATLNTRYQVDIAHMFTDLDLLKENKKKQDVKPTTLKEVLKIIKSTPACKVLLEGEGGIGKSTLLRYIAYNWATDESDETFKGKIVFLVNISSIGKGESVLDGILKQIDIEDFCLKTNLSQDPIIKQYIWNHDNDIVLLLDGLDELKDGSKSPISFFKNQNMPKCKVILTSRSDKKIDNFVKESSIHVKVKGFNAGNIKNYIKKHFHFFGEPALGDSLVDELFLGYKHADINLMCKNPMLLLSVCIMWEERQHLPADKTDLFKEIFRTILNQFIDRHADKEQKISIFKNIPQKYVEPMLLLGKCMYNGLKRNQLSINKADLEGKEEIVALALKLGFVYKDTPNLKSDFEEIFTAPHKLIVESLVGFYLYKLCQVAGLQSQCSEDMKRLLHPLDDSEWNIIIESEHLYIAKEFAIGFLGPDACMFLSHWITNSLATYRSLMAYFKFVKIEHRITVEKALIKYMTEKNLKIMPHINEICKSLRKFIHQVIPYVEINPNECFIHIMQRFYNIRLSVGGIDVITHIGSFCKEMSSEEKGKMIAHILIAVSDQSDILKIVNRLCGRDDIKYLKAECQKLNFKYDITYLDLCNLSTASYMVHLLSNAPQLEYLQCFSNCVTGAIMNDVMKDCSIQVVKLEELKELNISGNNFSNIDGSSLSSLLLIAPTLTKLNLSNCSLSGVIMNDVIRGCCCQEFKLELKELNISDNNLSNIDGSSFASLFIAPTLSKLNMCNCSLSGVIINDMIRECCSEGVQLELEVLDISNNNNLNNIDGSLFASLLGITSKLESLLMSNGSSYIVYNLHGLYISGTTSINIDGSSLAALLITFERNRLALINCSLSGVIMNDMIKECFSSGVRLKLTELDVNSNNLSSIDGSLLASLLDIAPEVSHLNMNNCSLSGDIINDMIRKCCSTGVNLQLIELSISGNNFSNIDGSSFSSIFITPTLSSLDMSNCIISGDIMNDMIREFCNRGFNSVLVEVDINGNNLSNIDGSLLASLLVITPLQYLNMSNCSLSGVIMDDMIRECCSKGVDLELVELDINSNYLSRINGSLLASLSVIAYKMSSINMSNCSLSGAIMTDMIRECCYLGIRLELIKLDISDNNLSSIDGSLLSSLLIIAPGMSNLNLSNCRLSCAIMINMIRECCSRGVGLKLKELHISDNNLISIDGSLLSSLFVFAPEISNLNISNCCFSGAIINNMIRVCCSRGFRLKLKELHISDNYLSSIDGSLLTSLFIIAHKISNINMSNCSLSGAIMTDMIRECCSLGVSLELIKLDISDNNLSSIDGSLLSSLLVIAPEISDLNMSNCCFSGAIINNMIRECCSRGLRLKLKELRISDNYLSSTDGSLLTSLLVIAHKMCNINMSNCSLSGAIMTDMIRECCSLGVSLKLIKLDISDNNLSNIDGSLLSSLLFIAPEMSILNMSNCCFSGAIINNMIRECCSRGFRLKLKELHISDNNLNSIDVSLLTSLLVIAPKMSNVIMSNCNLSGDIMNYLMRECCSRGVNLQLVELNISGNNFNKIDGSSLATLMVIAPTLKNLNMRNCNLSGAIMNDMIRDCSSRRVKLELKKLDICDNNVSNIDASSLASLLVIAPTLSNLNMRNCNLSHFIMNEMIKDCGNRQVKLELV